MRALHKLTHTCLTLLVLSLLAAGWLCLPAQHNALPGGAAASLQATLGLEKADSPDPVTAGSNLTYTVTLRNAGPAVAASPTMNDPLPPGTTFQSLNVTSPVVWNCTTPPMGSNGTITCNTNQLLPGDQAIFTIVVQVLPNVPKGTVLTNTVTATAMNAAPANASATTTVVAPVQADLSITKTGPPNVIAGQNLTYTITVANAGPADASNAVLNDPLPPNTIFQSLTAAAGWTCMTPAVNATGAVNCTRAVFTAGTNASFTLTVRLNPNVVCNLIVANQATVSSPTPDGNPSNNTATANTTAQSQADLAIASTGAPNPAPVGAMVTYTLTVTNNGPSDSVNARVTDTLPPGFTANSATPSVGTCSGTGTVNCTLGTLAPGGTATITIAAHVPGLCQPTMAVNTATVTSDNCLPDPLLGNNTTTFTSTLNIPNLGPGACVPSGSAISTTKPGSVLGFPFYTSSAASSNASNTRIALTNTHPTLGVALHLFFVDGASCGVADLFLCLTANQTAVFLISDIDPGISGFLLAVAVDGPPGFADGGNTGCPIGFNFLIGHSSIKLPVTGSGIGFSDSALVPTKQKRVDTELEAESIAAQFGSPVPGCNPNSVTAELRFDGTPTGYDLLPRVLAASNIPSRADGNSTLLVINRIGGNLAIGAATLGTLFGIIYDDTENPYSFQLTGACQLRGELSNNFPRSTPRFDAIIPAGRSGWLKIYGAADIAIIGATINNNVNVDSVANAFDGGHMLHKLTFTNTAVLTVPVFPPNC